MGDLIYQIKMLLQFAFYKFFAGDFYFQICDWAEKFTD